MTREEVISVLERLAHTESKWPGTDDTLEALDMAISALRQQETVTERNELTNAQKIRAMDDEELAEVLSAPCLGCVVKNCRLHNYGSGGCTIAFFKWLQQPAGEEEA